MSRNKKSRSLKRVTGGVKTGTKERTKLENKQKKARKKATSVMVKDKRQRSVYQKMVDENNATKDNKPNQPKKVSKSTEADQAKIEEKVITPEIEKAPKVVTNKDTELNSVDSTDASDEDLWDQFENPNGSNTF